MKELAAFVLGEMAKQPEMALERQTRLLAQLAKALAQEPDSDEAKRVAELADDLGDCVRRQTELGIDLASCNERQRQLALEIAQTTPEAGGQV